MAFTRVLCAFVSLLGAINAEATEVDIFIITNLDDSLGQSSAGAQWLAVNEINNRTDLLPNHTIKLRAYNGYDRHQSALYALNATKYQATSDATDTIYLPIILGSCWSSLSISIASILGTFNMGQISAAATSIALSDRNKYKYFYRTVPPDSAQSEGIILMCQHFNWTSIGIVYIQDAYGLYGAIGIEQLAAKNGIDTTAISISEEEDVTYRYAAQQIKELELYVIVFIVHENNLKDLFDEFKRAGITGYPYFFVATNLGIDGSIIRDNNLTQILAGSMATAPWHADSLTYDAYANDDVVGAYINESIRIGSSFFDSWTYHYENGHEADLYHLEVPTGYAAYGYDAMYTLAYALQHIVSEYGNLSELADRTEPVLMNLLNEAILNETDFIGATGHVMFDPVGDRLNWLFALGNILDDGSMDFFGYYYQEENGSFVSNIDWDKIVLPSYFTERNITPRSEVLIYREVEYVDYRIFIVMIALSSLSICIAAVLMIMQIWYRKKPIIRAGSWKLNVVMCIGAFFFFISTILYCMDEQFLIDQIVWNGVCNARFWMLSISMSILFIPLCLKTYRLGRMFKDILHNQVYTDQHLFCILLFCVSIDIILLTIFTVLQPFTRMYFNGDLEQMDALQQTQFVYGSCSVSSNINMMYTFVSMWKGCQFLFGMHSAMIVSRVREMAHILSKFDETGIQLLSIYLTVTIIIISQIVLFLIHDFKIQYVVIAMSLLLIGNIVLCFNLTPRIFAVITNNEDKYVKTPEQRIEAMIKEELSKFSKVKKTSLLSNYSNENNRIELGSVN